MEYNMVISLPPPPPILIVFNYKITFSTTKQYTGQYVKNIAL